MSQSEMRQLTQAFVQAAQRAARDHEARRQLVLEVAQVARSREHVLGRVEQVACVTKRYFGERGLGSKHSLNGRLHLTNVIECIEDAEDINAGLRGFVHEGLSHFGRVRGVSDSVSTAKQHLNTKVWHGLAKQSQALPRIFT